jgi:hypothetical protein
MTVEQMDDAWRAMREGEKVPPEREEEGIASGLDKK